MAGSATESIVMPGGRSCWSTVVPIWQETAWKTECYASGVNSKFMCDVSCRRLCAVEPIGISYRTYDLLRASVVCGLVCQEGPALSRTGVVI